MKFSGSSSTGARRSQPDCDDVLFWNERGEPTEFTVGNLVIELAGERYTLLTACGLLPGTLREWLLEQGQVRERVLLGDGRSSFSPGSPMPTLCL